MLETTKKKKQKKRNAESEVTMKMKIRITSIAPSHSATAAAVLARASVVEFSSTRAQHTIAAGSAQSQHTYHHTHTHATHHSVRTTFTVVCGCVWRTQTPVTLTCVRACVRICIYMCVSVHSRSQLTAASTVSVYIQHKKHDVVLHFSARRRNRARV